MRRYRPLPAVVFAILVSALVGGLFGRSALATEDKVPEHYKAFSAALSAIETNYIDKVDSENLVTGAIRGMLATLDPHSNYFTPREYAQMRERQEGHYYGLGISIQNTPEGDVIAMGVFEGSPAYKQGVRRGDIIAWIGTEDAHGWTTDQAMRKLRGPKGTSVDIALKRRGYDELIRLSVMRDEVTIPTVPAYFMIDATTGYIRMQEFGENTDRDVKRALRELAAKGMRRLLFDVRRNPGGPLDQAIKVANEFLPKGNKIVSTHGRIPNSDAEYRATEESEFTDIPIVMLANRDSASAAEIVTGALQDHDRAYIVGETTFGKALVQSVYKITNNAGLALTTAQAPVGRDVRRVPELLVEGPERRAPAQPDRSETHRRGPPGVQRRRHRTRQADRGSPRGIQSGALWPLALQPPGVRELRAEVRGRRRHADLAESERPPAGQAELHRRRRDAGGFPRAPEDEPRADG
ncbi:MAG: S41 family peptidase [Acidobacteria bacterium]|nr:S41 family peptidase [Acidobacteriota bacterium]